MTTATRALAAASALIVFAGSCASPVGTRPEHPSVVKVAVLAGGYGSGVVIADGWVLTCAHCVPARSADGLPATHHIAHPTLDLALIKVPGITSNGLQFGEEPSLHDRLFAYGWHLATYFLKTEGYQGGFPGLMSAPIIHGCSGGAVVDSGGDLIGIIQYVLYSSTASGMDGAALPHVSGYTPIGPPERKWIAEQLAAQ